MGTKLSAFPPALALGDADYFPGIQSAADVKITMAQVKTYLLASLAAVAASGSASDLSAGTLAAARLPALSGDISTSAGSAVTAIGTNKVTRGMLAQAAGATLLGATGAGNVADLTAAQAKTFLAIGPSDLAAQAAATILGNNGGGSAAPSALTAAQVKTLLAIGPGDVADKAIHDQAATSYTFALSDVPLWTRFTSASAITATIPPNSSVAFPIGTVLEGSTFGVGTVTFVAGAGVGLNSRGGVVATAGQYATWMLKKTDTNTWLLIGDLA